ncbi:hypothetical protein ACET3Z_001145 [Daucus carota]
MKPPHSHNHSHSKNSNSHGKNSQFTSKDDFRTNLSFATLKKKSVPRYVGMDDKRADGLSQNAGIACTPRFNQSVHSRLGRSESEFDLHGDRAISTNPLYHVGDGSTPVDAGQEEGTAILSGENSGGDRLILKGRDTGSGSNLSSSEAYLRDNRIAEKEKWEVNRRLEDNILSETNSEREYNSKPDESNVFMLQGIKYQGTEEHLGEKDPSVEGMFEQ